MTLSNEQCIAVAEEVWGLDSYQQDREYQNHQWYGHDSFPFEDFIKAEVLSWSGFGRTLEAMAERFLYLSLHPTECEFVAGLTVSFVRSDSTTAATMIYDPKDSNSLIEATHLAALAVRERKGG